MASVGGAAHAAEALRRFVAAADESQRREHQERVRAEAEIAERSPAALAASALREFAAAASGARAAGWRTRKRLAGRGDDG